MADKKSTTPSLIGRRFTLLMATAALAVAMVLPAHADGPPPLPVIVPPPPIVQLPPTQSCIETAIALGYLTGSARVGIAAVEACRIYAPVRFPQPAPPVPLGGYPQ